VASDLSYALGDRTFGGYLADGSGGKPAPGVLVIHEATGLGPHVKHKADQLAELGYVAFAADLFGEAVQSIEQAMGFVTRLTQDWAELRARGSAAFEALRSQPNVDASRMAAIGFCFGGQAVLELGRTGVDLRAIVGFHSGLTTLKPEDSRHIKAKVLVCMGDADPLIGRDARSAFMDNMAASKVDCQLLLFSGVLHSFTNPEADATGVPGCGYDAAADRRSWAAMQSLFSEAFE
jgi:dienelactone hydrolase